MAQSRRSVLASSASLLGVSLAGCGDAIETELDDGTGETGEQTSAFEETNVETEFISILNDERSTRGLTRLSQRNVLSEMGSSHAADMREHDYTGHEDSAGRTIEDRYRNRDLLPECELPAGDNRFYAGAENAAMGYIDREMDVGWGDGTMRITSERELAEFLYQGWYHSDGHRRVLFLESASEVGLGVAIAEDEQFYAAMEVC
jgi:uncharacterized protein YkwD